MYVCMCACVCGYEKGCGDKNGLKNNCKYFVNCKGYEKIFGIKVVGNLIGYKKGPKKFLIIIDI